MNCDQSSAGTTRPDVEKPRRKGEGVRRRVFHVQLRHLYLYSHVSTSSNRVDWLLGEVIMMGLARDDAYARRRFPDRATQAKTWLLVTGSKSVHQPISSFLRAPGAQLTASNTTSFTSITHSYVRSATSSSNPRYQTPTYNQDSPMTYPDIKIYTTSSPATGLLGSYGSPNYAPF